MKLPFRADIDYLRAIAVITVIGFHYEVPGFSGGFVGVDIFFVISGYLISRLIWAGLNDNSFSFLDFYDRRARRLLPSLYVMIVVTGAAAWVLAPPTDYRSFFQSAIATLLFSSNVFFWLNTSYFDLPTLGKLLIHTWSLSVEEQFYFMFPLATWLWSKGFRDPTSRTSIMLLLAATVALCVADELLIKGSPTAAFYLSPLRAWEFLVGGLVLFLHRWSPSNFALRCACAAAGAALMLIPVVTFTAEGRFPGFHALVPCLGAALFIFAFDRGSDRPVPLPARNLGLFLGKISYSLYLWHWPVFLLGTAAMPLAWTSSPWATVAMLAVSLLLGYLSYRFVETPPRATVKWAGLRLSGLIATAATVMVAVCVVGVSANGFPTRYPETAQRMMRYDIAVMGKSYREHSCLLEPQDNFALYDAAGCMGFAAGKINILLYGDSTAAHLVAALGQYLDPARYHLLQLNSAACAPFVGTSQRALPNCDQVNAAFATILKDRRLSAVILSAHWTAYGGPSAPDAALPSAERKGADASDPYLGSTLAATRDADIPVLLLGPGLEFPRPLAESLVRQEQLHMPVGDSLTVIKAAWKADANVERMATRYSNVRFASILQAVCIDQVCPLTADPETPMVWDTLHLTPEGSTYVVDRLKPELDAFLLPLKRPAPSEQSVRAVSARTEVTTNPTP